MTRVFKCPYCKLLQGLPENLHIRNQIIHMHFTQCTKTPFVKIPKLELNYKYERGKPFVVSIQNPDRYKTDLKFTIFGKRLIHSKYVSGPLAIWIKNPLNTNVRRRQIQTWSLQALGYKFLKIASPHQKEARYFARFVIENLFLGRCICSVVTRRFINPSLELPIPRNEYGITVDNQLLFAKSYREKYNPNIFVDNRKFFE